MSKSNWKIFEYDIIDSTNESAKKLCSNAYEKFIVTANAQTNGKGQFGRKWLAPPQKNMLASFVINENLFDANINIALATAIAVCKFLEKFSISPKCKWPNDILINNAKIAGILIEKFNYFFIIGIGLNINWPEKITLLDNKKKATSILAETGEKSNVKYAAISIAELLNSTFENKNIINEYKSYWNNNLKCHTLFNEKWIPVTLTDIDTNGALIAHSAEHGIIKINSSALIKTNEI